ncbi:unnamed protein product [Coffea canephora]|uniref:Uncharacterized protein n=1 Tax=Coffea canephora TaxID=49390 RepID=A0A068TZN7_COFCA|nr:unnamed protein product [Coffea canephora]
MKKLRAGLQDKLFPYLCACYLKWSLMAGLIGVNVHVSEAFLQSPLQSRYKSSK